jgi:hypothetical protein
VFCSRGKSHGNCLECASTCLKCGNAAKTPRTKSMTSFAQDSFLESFIRFEGMASEMLFTMAHDPSDHTIRTPTTGWEA